MDIPKLNMSIQGQDFVPKGWGHEIIIVNKPKYCGKILHLDTGKKLSWHVHKAKDETFYCLKGEVMLIYGEDNDINKAQQIHLKKGDSFYIYPGLNHRLYAFEDSDIIEISTQHFEDDSIRIIKGD
jgi:quercetin dioxygenase-like cupin family protein